MPSPLLQAASRLASAADLRADAQLVAAFLNDTNQEAFAELVRRHGPAVFGVCRRVLGPTPDAEDAFQATFLVLIRRARSTEWRASLGPWLYGVALRVAHKARRGRATRLANERQGPATSEPTIPPTEPDDSAAVDEELAALPAIYRRPLVLCEIQGASRRDAARELGLTEGTLSSRLARGRKMLRARLVNRGIVPGITGLGVAVPAALATATVRNAMRVLGHTSGAVPVGVLFLAEGVTKTMIAKWKWACVLVVTCLGLTGFGSWQGSAQPVPPIAATRPVVAPPAVPSEKEKAPGKPPEWVAEDNRERVATIFGDVAVTREQFADHLIKRYGKKELELFVRKQIIAHAFGKKGWVISAAEIQAVLDEDCKALGMTREQFAKEILPRYNKTLEQWTEDAIEPRLMLAQLLNEKQPVTAAELRQTFDDKYGEKVECRVIVWRKDQEEEARRATKGIDGKPDVFDHVARALVSAELWLGRRSGFPRHPGPDTRADLVAASKLKPGEVSPLVETKTGFVLIRCREIIPADKDKSFDTEKPALLAEVTRARIEREIPKLFDELKREAKPEYHLTFPEPVPQPKK